MATNARREPLARLSLQPGNRPPSAAAPLKPVEGRLSLNGKRESLAGGRRESLAGRPSISSYSRTSLSGNPRQSLAPAAAPNRLSLGGNSANNNRRTSLAVLNKAADPRPIGKKEYTAQCVKTILAFLTAHNYAQTCTSKTLLSPTRADFKSIMTFLFHQIDPNFEFGANMEDEFRCLMKFFGYPISISKTALVPVGSPHTWPGILAAVVWFIEFLNYDAELTRAQASKLDLEVSVDPEEMQDELNPEIFFAYAVKAFRKFIDGDDSQPMDEDLVQAFQKKNKQSSDNILKLQAKVDALKAEKIKLKNPEAEIKKLESLRETLALDVEKFKKCISQLQEHKTQQAALLGKMKVEYEEKKLQLANHEKEKEALAAVLEKQEFTPLQVQEMNHQKKLLSDNLEALETQKATVQQEIWAQETANSKALFELDKRVKLFNECALLLELTPVGARYARGIDYQLKMQPSSRLVSNLVGLDLTKTVKPAVLTLKKQLIGDIANQQADLREAETRRRSAQELREEENRKVKCLEEKAARFEEAYRLEKEGCEAEMNGNWCKIEASEAEVHQMKAVQSRILEESETKIHQLDSELVQQRHMHIAARGKLLREIQDMSNRVMEHKDMVSRVLKDVLSNVASTRENLSRSVSNPRKEEL